MRLNKRWKFKKDEIKNERRGPDSEQKMRYFKIPLCWNFVQEVRDYSDRMTRVNGSLGQKLGYDRCPYLSFFVWRLEDEIFDSTGRRDLNTKYTIFDLRRYECLWCNYKCKTMKTLWLGRETTMGYLDLSRRGPDSARGQCSFAGEKGGVLWYWFGMERHILTRRTGDDSWEIDG